jgi:hypothetical protein
MRIVILPFLVILLTLLFLGCLQTEITQPAPFTTQQFFTKFTDLNYNKFVNGEYDQNLMIVDGNKILLTP